MNENDKKSLFVSGYLDAALLSQQKEEAKKLTFELYAKSVPKEDFDSKKWNRLLELIVLITRD